MSGLEREYKLRKINYKILNGILSDKAIKINTIYPSFFILSVERKDDLRQYLSSKKIFCPVHWPQVDGVSNEISETLLSIPVDSRYDGKDMKIIASYVNQFYKN